MANGGDTVEGDAGVDTVQYSSRTGNLTVTLNGLAERRPRGRGRHVLPTIENVNGGSGADTILAGPTAVVNRLRGGGRGDT